MKISRRFTKPSVNAFDTVEYERRSCAIKNPDGSVVFQMHDIEVPKDWSQLASDILISKYLRKAGVPGATGHETSIKQVLRRLAHVIRVAGEEMGGYFEGSEDGEAFEQELVYVLLHQMGAFNSPTWFNCGLYHEYGIGGTGGNWHWSDSKADLEQLENNYKHPQCSACFIQSVEDDLMSIFDLVKNEARIFKYGSGTGTNFSNIRGKQENLSGGGTSSGLMSFLEVFDRAAGATKSGGTTRRAAKMVCLDVDHPEIRDFVRWKRREEKKVRALIEAGYPADFNGEAYHTISGQNSNNSVRLSDDFMNAYLNDREWKTRFRTTEQICETFPARDLMQDICESAWECADPGVQFDTTINDWHTCSATGPIRSSNPCSEFMFVDDSACNLASINLMKYVNEDGSFAIDAFLHTIRIFILAQEILVDFSSYPTKEIARNSHLFRPLGLGYANLGSLLMLNSLPYDSERGRAMGAALTAIMTGYSYKVSAEIAATKRPFTSYDRNTRPMLRVIKKHRDAVNKIASADCPADLLEAARKAWDEALKEGELHGYRNAQVTVLAPTGTIGLLMDCDTTGIEPDYALVKFKKLAGGGYFKIVNQTVEKALENLGYGKNDIRAIIQYATGTQTLDNAPHINTASLKAKGLTDEDLQRVSRGLPGAFDLDQALSVFTLGKEALERLGFKPEQTEAPGFNVPSALGFTDDQIDEASRVVCGTMTIEGAPGLKPEHYAVFDCANRCGELGTRFIEPMGHVRMMAAVQPFISGAISKTVNMPNSATPEEIENVYVESWKMGLKAVALYRDGCKSSQPLNVKKDKKEGAAAEAAAAPAPTQGQLELFPEIAEYGPTRRRLPLRRGGFTVEAKVGGHKVYLRTGEYEDGKLGEIFIDMFKEGAAFRAIINCFAVAVSKGLQYGVPLREFVDTFTFTRFEPQGICDHPNIKFANSVIDFVFRVLGMEYLGQTELCQVKPEPPTTDSEPSAVQPKSVATAPAPKMLEAPAAAPAAGQTTASAAGQATTAKGNGKPSSTNGASSNGNGNGATAKVATGQTVTATAKVTAGATQAQAAGGTAMDRQLGELMGDAPFCDTCGHITVRNGSCYKCMNCGNSMGCS